tara:strand:+ start:591 stop:707 length:117 start_codon:yes stop_codon:yes gene_type:complete
MNKRELELQQQQLIKNMNEKLDKILSLLNSKKKKVVKK